MSNQYDEDNPVSRSLELSPEMLSAAQENLEKISQSSIFLTLFTGDMYKETIPCLQLGLAMMLDKPIIIACEKGTKIPDNMRKVATAIFEGDMRDDDFQHWLGREISMMKED